VLGRVRDRDVAGDVRAAVSHDVVITHDGKRLFAYAANEAALSHARDAIEGALRSDGIEWSVRVSHWDEGLDGWRQTDPPPTAKEQQTEQAAMRDAETVETVTMVASAGRLVRDALERSMLDWADRLNIQCTIVEHPHLLTTQVGFTITGPRHRLDEFAEGLAAEETATIRAERTLMLDPL
jgi:hypothetical protein